MPTITNPPFYFSTENCPKRREPRFLMTYHVVCTLSSGDTNVSLLHSFLSFPFARTERTLLMVTPRGRREDQRHLDARKEPRKWLRDTQRGREKEEEREEKRDWTAFLSSEQNSTRTEDKFLLPLPLLSPRHLSYLLSAAFSISFFRFFSFFFFFFLFFTPSEFNRNGHRSYDRV